MNINKISNFLKKYDNFLIVAHTSPEGDCLGAQLAFAGVLKAMGKNYEIVNNDIHAVDYAFLPGISDIKTHPRAREFQAAIVLDCSDISRIGKTASYLNKDTPILNIDHHVSNTYFGNINLVDAAASSACEVLYLLFEKLKIRLNKNIAKCLYAGIVADTGSFRYPNTSASTHLIASKLLEWGIDACGIYRDIYENLELPDLLLINKIQLNTKMDKTGKVAWISITNDMLGRRRSIGDLTEGILNFIRSIKGVEACILLRQKVGKGSHVRVNLRSRGKIDVNKIAQHFGGGGHKTASGITLKGISLKKAEVKIINFIKKEIRK